MKYAFLITTLAVVAVIIGIAAFSNFKLDDEHYDRLKALAMKWHYITAFVAAIVKVFDLPYGVETVVIVAAIGALMAGLLGVSTKEYNKLQNMFIPEPEDSYSDRVYTDEELAELRAEALKEEGEKLSEEGDADV
jgi:TRAP-type C4-dicarboxylate transport system permease large subunit